MDILALSLTFFFLGLLGMQIFLQNKLSKMHETERVVKEVAMSHLWNMIFEDHEMMVTLARKSKSKAAKELFNTFLIKRENAEEEFLELMKKTMEPQEKPSFKVTTKL